MSSLSPEARARLMAFRRAESPDPEVAERCLAAVERRAAAAPEATGPSRRVIVGAAILALAAGLLLALRWASAPTRRAAADGMGAPYHDARAPGHEQPARRDAGAAKVIGGPADPGAAIDPAAAGPRGESDTAAEMAGSRSESDTAAETAGSRGESVSAAETAGSRGESDTAADSRGASDTADAAGSRGARATGPTRADPRARGRDGADDIAAEVALLREAKLAAPARRLELLAAHARRFPGGAFAAEAALLEIEARCELGEAVQARSLAARFARRFSGSPLAARAARVCADIGAPAP